MSLRRLTDGKHRWSLGGGLRESSPVLGPKGLICCLLDGEGLGVFRWEKLDGKEAKHVRVACDGAHRPAFAADGRHWAALITSADFHRDEKSRRPRVGVKGFSATEWAEDVPRGKDLWALVFDGEQEEGLWDDASHLTFEPQGRRVAFRVRNDRKWHLVVHGVGAGPGFDQVGRPVFDKTGKRVAFWALKGREVHWKVRKLGR